MTIKNYVTKEIKEGRMTRRRLMQIGAAAGVGLATMPKSALAQSGLNVLTWSGYDIPELAPSYFKSHGAPSFTLQGSDEEGFQKVRAGFRPDLAHHTSFIVPKLRDANLLKPVDTSRLEHWDDFFPELKGVEYVNGQTWIAPCSWGNSSVIYRKDLLPDVEESWGLLWDPAIAGKIAMRDSVEGTLIVAGLFIGAADPWDMTDAELADAKKALLEQKKLLRFYWSSQTDLQQSVASGEIVAAYGWNASVALLRKEGIDMGLMTPKEGIITWTDGLVLFKGQPGSEDEAYEFINAYMSPEVGEFLINSYGYASGNLKAYENISEERLIELGISDPQNMLATSKFQKAVSPERRPLYQDVFDEVKFAG